MRKRQVLSTIEGIYSRIRYLGKRENLENAKETIEEYEKKY